MEPARFNDETLLHFAGPIRERKCIFAAAFFRGVRLAPKSSLLMDGLITYRIPLLGLHEGLHQFEFDIDGLFFREFEHSPVRQGAVLLRLGLDKRPGLAVLNFAFEGTLHTVCDRCLEPFDLPIQGTRQLLVKYGEEACEEEEVIYLKRGTPHLNVAKFIYEFLLLSMPLVRLHEAAGLSCNPEVLKFLRPSNKEENQERPNPFRDALKNWKKPS